MHVIALTKACLALLGPSSLLVLDDHRGDDEHNHDADTPFHNELIKVPWTIHVILR